MNVQSFALHGCPIFDGQDFHHGKALLVENGRVQALVADTEIPPGHARQPISNGFLAPGLVDLQVNGGGGVLFNDDTSPSAIATICAAHLRFGTTALLPTLITDVPEKTTEAIAAVKFARTPGCIGLHLEGPHLSIARKGAHDPALIRPMEPADLTRLTTANLPSLLTTLAIESTTPVQIKALAETGIIVSLGHTDCTLAQALHYANAGATCVTHLFNAMSQLAHRAPGLVGAALDDGRFSAGLIADGIHVDQAAMSVALRAKRGPGHIFLVSDAMSPIGTDMTSFTLSGHRILRQGGRLVREDDGTLAGADITLLDAVRYTIRHLGLPRAEALRMATRCPAQVLRRESEFGTFQTGARADVLHLDDSLNLLAVWQAGQPV